jgi:hypothetical protein
LEDLLKDFHRLIKFRCIWGFDKDLIQDRYWIIQMLAVFDERTRGDKIISRGISALARERPRNERTLRASGCGIFVLPGLYLPNAILAMIRSTKIHSYTTKFA